MDLSLGMLIELAKQAKKEEIILKNLEMELNDCGPNDTVKFIRLERKYDDQYERFWKQLREVKRCLKSIRNLYEYRNV